HAHLASFPTRRSSDLKATMLSVAAEEAMTDSPMTTFTCVENALLVMRNLLGIAIIGSSIVCRPRTGFVRCFCSCEAAVGANNLRSVEHTSELQSRENL